METSDRSAARAKWSEFPSKLNDLRQPLNPAETAWRPTRRLAANNDHTVLDTLLLNNFSANWSACGVGINLLSLNRNSWSKPFA